MSTRKKPLASDKVLPLLRTRIRAEYPSFSEFARDNQKSIGYVTLILTGKKHIPSWMLERFGITRESTYTVETK